MSYILGVNAYHGDSSACIIRDGRLIAAAEEERFRRIKHWAGFPSRSIAYCLREAGVRLADVEHVAVNRDQMAHRWRRIAFALRHGKKLAHLAARLKGSRKWGTFEQEFERAFPGDRLNAKLHSIEHHVAHLASAFFVSPYEEAAAVSVDGSGDFASTCWGFGTKASIDVDGRVFFPHSLGVFYEAVTQFLGFPHYGDEYKVMGLAPYGEPRFVNELQRVLLLQNDGTFKLDLSYFQHHSGDPVHRWVGEAPVTTQLFTDKLTDLLGPARRSSDPMEQRYKDIARSVQATYEDALFHLLDHVYKKRPSENLVLAGGCANNSVANGKIHLRSRFRNCYIPASAGDAGGAIGAAFAAHHQIAPAKRHFEMNHAYWGPSFGDDAVAGLLSGQRSNIKSQGCDIVHIADEDTLCRTTAKAISEGKVVGWFQGRMEWGPRALGGRSIVCDPRRADMKDILNLKIKRRESFRPFAPSILREAVSDWFESDDDVPFMMKVFQIRSEKRAQLPAVTHVDGSGRLQTVTREASPTYYRLIECFGEITGVPIVLNTSFNENEPVVCTPEEALACFLRTNMDMLVLGNHVVSRNGEFSEAKAASAQYEDSRAT